MKNLFLLLIILSITACNNKFVSYKTTLHNEDLPNECNGLVQEINVNWLKNNKINLYKVENDEFILKRLVFYYTVKEKCITQLDTSQIIQLFGEPSERKLGQFNYFMDKDCFNPYPTQCKYLEVRFNDNGQILKLDESGAALMN
ncbi:MAG: hypothetical protein AB8G11_08555 [Saprospiraceae bacterium]